MAAPALLHQAYGTNSGTVSTVSITITSSTAGNLLAVDIDCLIENPSDTLSVSGVTDNKGQTWSKATGAAGSYLYSGAYPAITDIWYFPNSAAGVTTVTVTFTGTGVGTDTISTFCEVSEITGCATSSPVDAVASLSNATSTTVALSASVTTTLAQDFILTVIPYNAFPGSITSVTSPYTIGGTVLNTDAYYVPSGTVSSSQASFNGASSGTAYSSSTVAFKAAGAGSSNPYRPWMTE